VIVAGVARHPLKFERKNGSVAVAAARTAIGRRAVQGVFDGDEVFKSKVCLYSSSGLPGSS
jgi:hypothetical protein